MGAGGGGGVGARGGWLLAMTSPSPSIGSSLGERVGVRGSLLIELASKSSEPPSPCTLSPDPVGGEGRAASLSSFGSTLDKSISLPGGNAGGFIAGPSNGASQGPPAGRRKANTDAATAPFILEKASSRALVESLRSKNIASTTRIESASLHSRGLAPSSQYSQEREASA